MRICLIVEGAYPFLTGGVSSWMQQMMTQLDDVEFIIETLSVRRDEKKEFKYIIPPNVSQVRELYLFDKDYVPVFFQKPKLTSKEYRAFRSLMFGQEVDWPCLFDFFQKKKVSVNSLLTGPDFLEMTREYYEAHHDKAVFSDFLWTMRSMYMPLFLLLKNKPTKADVYHSMSTGYSGVFGSLCKYIHKKPLIVSEHGIYTREREEEIIKAKWVRGLYKDLWIQQFKKFSQCSYDMADDITALFEAAKDFQVELGCPSEKINVISNGVHLEQFNNLVPKEAADTFINIGAVVRVTPIKDIKTMIHAFSMAKAQVNNLKLWIMGPLTENEEYAQKCRQLVQELEVEDVVFTGKINVKEYLGKMDMMVLSSLSEGQPLVILEGFAAKKPFITTDVGDCRNLVLGLYDNYGPAGAVVPIMGIEAMANAMVELAQDQELRQTMGSNGYERVKNNYQNHEVFENYHKLYLKNNQRQGYKEKR